jgi:hypothetical protein
VVVNWAQDRFPIKSSPSADICEKTEQKRLVNNKKKRIDTVGVLVGLLCVQRACARVRLARGQEPFLIFRRRALPEPKTIVKHQATVDHGIYT